MLLRVDWQVIRQMSDNCFFLDYVAGEPSATDFFSLPPLAFDDLKPRINFSYPRQQVVEALYGYAQALKAPQRTLENISALAHSDTFCVISGQQAGLLGGPAFTLYKIATTIRLARLLQERLSVRVIPVYWLASEDHDLQEVNHLYYVRSDGEIGRLKFDWAEEGRPIEDLPITPQMHELLDKYWAQIKGPYTAEIRRLLAPREERLYCSWQARIWTELFASHGLVVIEPRILRHIGAPFFRRVLERTNEIKQALAETASALKERGYSPSLDPRTYGGLYTRDRQGKRVRVTEPEQHLPLVSQQPERYSPDAALRPLFADTVLPVLASVLGPGETRYQAMLGRLYRIFELPQPIIFPRQSLTLLSKLQYERLRRYQISPIDLLTGEINPSAVMQRVAPPALVEKFDQAEQGIQATLTPLLEQLLELDPNLQRTFEQTQSNILRALNKLRDRGIRAAASRKGLSKAELQALRNIVLPRGRLQERVLPVPHFLSIWGPKLIDRLVHEIDVTDFCHLIWISERQNA